MKFKYVGETERVFPALRLTVKPGDEFNAPDNFAANGVIPVVSKTHSSSKVKTKHEEKESFVADKTKEETTDLSAPSDKTLGE